MQITRFILILAIAALASERTIAKGSNATTNGIGTSPDNSARPPLWQVYYDEGMRLLREREYNKAIKQLNDARTELAKTSDARDTDIRAEICTEIAKAHLRMAAKMKPGFIQDGRLSSALTFLYSAKKEFLQNHEADSLVVADAIERIAEARITLAETRTSLHAYLGRLDRSAQDDSSVSDLLLSVLAIRVQHLGETDSSVMMFQRNISRRIYGWIRKCRKLKEDETNPKVLYESEPKIESLRNIADQLKTRDRELRLDPNITSNGVQ